MATDSPKARWTEGDRSAEVAPSTETSPAAEESDLPVHLGTYTTRAEIKRSAAAGEGGMRAARSGDIPAIYQQTPASTPVEVPSSPVYPSPEPSTSSP